MLLAVAGLSEEEIQERTRKLAAGDWSDFPPTEQTAFSFAYRLTKEPQSISDRDIQQLTDRFGPVSAIDLIWYASWCNYMTRVADAFQFNLEMENVFLEPEKKSESDEGKDEVKDEAGEPDAEDEKAAAEKAAPDDSDGSDGSNGSGGTDGTGG